MVYKKKVSDRHHSMEGNFGVMITRYVIAKANTIIQTLTMRKRLLVLKDSSSVGKTATISILDRVIDIDISE